MAEDARVDVVEKERIASTIAQCLRRDDPVASSEALTRIMATYAEHPLLLDVHVGALLKPVVDSLVEALSSNRTLTVEACTVVYVFAKVRGEDAIGKVLPHDVTFLERVALSLQSLDAAAPWECIYVLLLWLSQLVLVPFNLATVHSHRDATFSLVALGKLHLGTRGKPSEVAQVMLARLLTRPDLEGDHLRSFLVWAVDRIVALQDDPFLVPALLSTLARIFALGSRERLVPLAALVFPLCKWSDAPSLLLRKNVTKVAQRVGLVYLPPRVAPWRYKRGHRVLMKGVVAPARGADEEDSAGTASADDWFVPVEVDRIIHVLLCGLRDRDTVVRWSAAKGIGRITDRLPLAFADLVVETVMELCSPTEEEHAWHGSCLAIAELARRGLLLPNRLENALPAVLEALRYDVKQGTRSVGSQVRDAACYVLWACARAYAPAVMSNFTPMIAGALLEAAALDREINCRRAASAAFQEHVGRVGLIKHGLDLVIITDYFKLGSLRSAYRDVACQVCQFAEYSPWILDTLLNRKIRHWDPRVRDEAAFVVGAVAPLCAEQLINALPKLRESTVARDDADLRHGALLALGRALKGLQQCGARSAADLGANDVTTVVPELEAARLFRGKGGESVRVAACVFTQCLAESRIPLTLNAQRLLPFLNGRPDSGKTSAKRHKEFLDECLRNASLSLQEAAAAALQPFCEAYLCGLSANVRAGVVNGYIAMFSGADALPSFTRGAALALRVLPGSLFEGSTTLVSSLETLCGAVKTSSDAETRKFSVQALAGRLERLVEGESVAAAAQSLCIDAMLCALCDYTMDERGDVGSWTREAACESLGVFVKKLNWTRSLLNRAVGALIQIMAGRMDRLRVVALAALHGVLENHPELDHALELLQLFPRALIEAPTGDKSGEEEGDPMLLDEEAFRKLPQEDAMGPALWRSCATCLGLPLHRKTTLEALCTSSGLRTPDPAARQALLEFLFSRMGDHELLKGLWEDFAALLEEHGRDERLLPHLLCCCDVIVRNGCFDCVVTSRESADRVRLAAYGAFRSNGAIPTLCVGVDLCCALLRFSQGAKSFLKSSVLPFLGHRYPRVRQHVALQLRVQFLTCGTQLCSDNTTCDRIVFVLSLADDPECSSVLGQISSLLGPELD